MRKSEMMRRSLKIICLAGTAALSSRAQAVVLFTWDASGNHSSSPQDGLGTWSTANLNWTSTGSGADVGWTNSTSNPALIGSNNNAVTGVQDITLGAAITLGNLTFGTVNGGSYDIVGTSANTLGMTGGTPTVTVNANVTAEIDAPIAVTGSQPDLTVAGSGTLDMNPTVEGTNYHGVILAGTSNVVLASAAAVPIAVPNNNSAVVFDGGTLTFAATPSTDISGRFSTSGTGATSIAVTNGAVVTLANPLGGSNGLTVSGSGSGSTLKLNEGSGSQVAFNGSGGVNVNGATLYLTGNNNNELGSNAVTVGASGVLSSDSTKFVTTGTTMVNGTITGGSGDLSGNTYGNMHLSATTFGATGAYDWKLNVAPSTAYHTGSIINSVMTSGSLNANSLTNFDTLLMSSLTDTASGFGIKLITAGASNLATGTYDFAIANTASGTFNTSNFNYSGFTLTDVADSTLAAASNGGVNSELDGGTGQDLILAYTVAPSTMPIIALTAGTASPGSAYGPQITNGTGASQGLFTGPGASSNVLSVVGSHGSYVLAQVTGIEDASSNSNGPQTGFVVANGFTPTTDAEVFALDVEVNGSQASAIQLNTLLTQVNTVGGLPTGVTVSTSSPSPNPFPGIYNFFVDYSGVNGDDALGFDLLSSNDSNLVGFTVSAVAVVPEPMSLTLLALGGAGLMTRRNRRKA